MQSEFLMNFSLRRKRHEFEEPCKRSGHVAVHCSGYMLMWGGYKDERDTQESHNLGGDRYMNGEEVWCLDIEARKWHKWISKRNRPDGMSGSCAVCVGHTMYIIGGHKLEGNTNELFQFDIRRKAWTHLKPNGMAPTPRDKFICWPYEDKLIIFGGFGPPPDHDSDVKGEWVGDPSSHRYYEHELEVRGWNNHVFVYNIRTNEWSQPAIQGSPPCPRAAHAGCVIGQRGYVYGGRFGDVRRGDLHYLDLENMRWSGELNVEGNVPDGRSWHGMAACSDRHLMIYGGFTTSREALADVWVFDTVSEKWSQLENQSTEKPRLWHTVVSSHSPGEVIAFGGCTNNILDPGQYDIQTNQVVSFYFSPKSLARLCTEAIVHYKDTLGNQIALLPKSLVLRVEDFMQGMLSNGSHYHSYNLRSRHGEEQREEAMDER